MKIAEKKPMAGRFEPEHDETAKPVEAAARAAVAGSTGQNLTDKEWQRARARLLEYAMILRAWGQYAKSNTGKADDVVRRQNRASDELALDDAA
jgi:hypothetical protein